MDDGDESQRVAQLVARQGTDFVLSAEFLAALQTLHAKPVLLESLRGAKVFAGAQDQKTEQAAYSALLTCLQKANSGQDSEAETECLKAETIDASTARFALGRLAQRRQKWEEAVQYFKDAVQANPSVPDTHNYLGFAFDGVRRFEEGEAEYRVAMRLDPEYETPVSNLAVEFLRRNDPIQAERYARQAVHLMKDDASAHNNLAMALVKQGKFADGVVELREAKRLEPEIPFRHTVLADLYVSAEKYEDAVEEYRQAAALAPQDAQIHYKLLQMLLLLKRRDEAVAECEKLKTLTPMKSKDSCKEFVRKLVGN